MVLDRPEVVMEFEKLDWFEMPDEVPEDKEDMYDHVRVFFVYEDESKSNPFDDIPVAVVFRMNPEDKPDYGLLDVTDPGYIPRSFPVFYVWFTDMEIAQAVFYSAYCSAFNALNSVFCEMDLRIAVSLKADDVLVRRHFLMFPQMMPDARYWDEH